MKNRHRRIEELCLDRTNKFMQSQAIPKQPTEGKRSQWVRQLRQSFSSRSLEGNTSIVPTYRHFPRESTSMERCCKNCLKFQGDSVVVQFLGWPLDSRRHSWCDDFIYSTLVWRHSMYDTGRESPITACDHSSVGMYSLCLTRSRRSPGLTPHQVLLHQRIGCMTSRSHVAWRSRPSTSPLVACPVVRGRWRVKMPRDFG